MTDEFVEVGVCLCVCCGGYGSKSSQRDKVGGKRTQARAVAVEWKERTELRQTVELALTGFGH